MEEAVKTCPNDPEAYAILGNIALQDRRIAEATLDFDKAKQLLAKYTNAERKSTIEQQTLNGIAQLAELPLDFMKAETCLRELLRLAPEDLDAHLRLARALFWQGKAKDAYDILKAAKQIDRENARRNNERGTLLPPEATMAQYYDQFEDDTPPPTGNAEVWFKAALKKAPDDLPARQVVALWALENGKIAFAKEQAEAALRIEAADASLPPKDRKYSASNVGRMLRGLVALWEKDWPTAEKYFEKAVLEDPHDFAARNNLALALAEQNDPAKKLRALDYAESNYNANKNNPEALATLGWVHFRRGEFDQAGLALDQAVKVIDRAVRAADGTISPDRATLPSTGTLVVRLLETGEETAPSPTASGCSIPHTRATGGKIDPNTVAYVAHILHNRQQDWEAKAILENILKSGQSFSMKPEAERLYEKVKDAKEP